MVLCLEHNQGRDRLPAWKMIQNKQFGSFLHSPCSACIPSGQSWTENESRHGEMKCSGQRCPTPTPHPAFLGRCGASGGWIWPLKFLSAMVPLSQSQVADIDLSLQGFLPFFTCPFWVSFLLRCGKSPQIQHTSSALLRYFYYLGILEGKLIKGRLRLTVRHL